MSGACAQRACTALLARRLLSEKGLDGVIPSAGWRLPQNLTELNLHKNMIKGRLPEGAPWPPSLLFLDLSANLLTGTIPANLALPDGLEHFNLDYNAIGGPIPAGELPSSLKKLYLALMDLTGTIPPEWALPSSLEQLTLQNNRLNGTLPAQWVRKLGFCLSSPRRRLLRPWGPTGVLLKGMQAPGDAPRMLVPQVPSH